MAVLRIINARIYDGSLNPPVDGEVWIRGDKIVSVGASRPGLQADETVDARGRVVCPAFVDIHRHLDVKPFTDWTGETELRQGIATTVVGNCGMSMTPVSPEYAAAHYAFEEPVLGPMCENPPQTYRAYLAALESRPLPLNIAAMIGTGAVRISLKGFSNAPFTQEEMRKAQALIADSLDAGAPGVSLGIMYLPECYGSIDEFAEMLKPVGERGGVICTHIRGEDNSLVSSVEEVVEIARRAGCALEISHFKSCGVKNWRREIFKAIERVEAARARGQDVTCDLYPYDRGSTALTTMLPPAFVRGDMDAALRRLGTPEGVEEFRESAAVEYPDWDNSTLSVGWDRILISAVVREENRKYVGLSVAEGAARYGYADAPALAAHLMHDEDGRTSIITRSMCQDDIDVIARLPYASFISDAIYNETDTPHPRMYGSMPKVIREYVRERGLLTMEEAIHKMTAQPAARMGLEGRGELKPGAFADVLMFDPAVFRDNATFESPARLASGLDLMLVNGRKVIENDVLLTSAAGRCLRRGI